MPASAPHGLHTRAGRALGGLDVLKGCSRLVYAARRVGWEGQGRGSRTSSLALASCPLATGEVVMVNQGGCPWCE